MQSINYNDNDTQLLVNVLQVSPATPLLPFVSNIPGKQSLKCKSPLLQSISSVNVSAASVSWTALAMTPA